MSHPPPAETPLTKRRYEAGDVIFMQGDPGTETFMIREGRVELIKRDAGGLFETLATLGPGQLFGEMALATDRPRAAGARALEDTVCIVIGRGQLDAKLEAADPFVAALFRILAGNLQAIAEQKEAAEKSAATSGTAQPVADLEKFAE